MDADVVLAVSPVLARELAMTNLGAAPKSEGRRVPLFGTRIETR
jgi:hypothetical protein